MIPSKQNILSSLHCDWQKKLGTLSATPCTCLWYRLYVFTGNTAQNSSVQGILGRLQSSDFKFPGIWGAKVAS